MQRAKETEIHIQPRKLLWFLLAMTGFVIVSHFIAYAFLLGFDLPEASVKYALLQKLNLEGELTVSAWFSSSLILVASLFLFLNGLVLVRNNRSCIYWFLLSIIFIYLSIDEASGIHELAVGPVRNGLHISNGYLYLAWFIPALFALALIAPFFIKFWLGLQKKIRVLFIISFVTFIAGSVIVESFSGNFYLSNPSVGFVSIPAMLFIALEESLEMLGVVIFIYALSLNLTFGRSKIVFQPSNYQF